MGGGGGVTGGGGGGGATGGGGGGIADGGNDAGVLDGGVPLVCFDVDAGAIPDAGPLPSAEPFDGGYPDFCLAYADATCAQSVRCGETLPAAAAECVAFYRRLLCDLTVDEVRRGMLRFDRAAAGLCLSNLDAACNQLTQCGQYMFAATDAGGVCLSGRDCAAAGEGCAGPSCARTCQVTGALGGPCPNGRCNAGLWCELGSATCRAHLSVDAGCSGEDGVDPQCQPGLATCDTDAGRCVSLPLAGQSCRTTIPRCATSAWCDVAPAPGTCRSLRAVGESCSNSAQCGVSGYCEAAVCLARKLVGATCAFTGQCQAPGMCSAGVCSRPKLEGEPCRASECVSPSTCDSVSRVCSRTSTRRAGELCTGVTQTCTTDSLCIGAQPNRDGGAGCVGRCVPKRLGDVCTNPFQCPAQSWCSPSGDAGTCVPADGGNPCSAFTQCGRDFTCIGGACRAKVSDGQPCDSYSGCLAPWRCLGLRPDAGGVCGLARGPDAGCTANEDCAFPQTCRGSTCVPSGHLGESCILEFYCLQGACDRDAGTCEALRPDGGICLWELDCESGSCFELRCAPRCP